MNLKSGLFSIGIGILLLFPAQVAESRNFTISWDPVTAYTDNSPISGVSVTYTIYWTADPALSPASLKPVSTALPNTSTVFDPELLGMTVGQRVYFAAKAVLATGLESSLSPSYMWTVPPPVEPGPSPPPLPPPPPPPTAATLSSLSIGGPASVSGGGSGQFTATATMSDGSTRTVSPVWSVSPATYSSIGATGLLTASQVSSSQTVTVAASYTLAGVTRSASKAVTISDVSKTPATPAIKAPVKQ